MFDAKKKRFEDEFLNSENTVFDEDFVFLRDGRMIISDSRKIIFDRREFRQIDFYFRGRQRNLLIFFNFSCFIKNRRKKAAAVKI